MVGVHRVWMCVCLHASVNVFVYHWTIIHAFLIEYTHFSFLVHFRNPHPQCLPFSYFFSVRLWVKWRAKAITSVQVFAFFYAISSASLHVCVTVRVCVKLQKFQIFDKLHEGDKWQPSTIHNLRKIRWKKMFNFMREKHLTFQPLFTSIIFGFGCTIFSVFINRCVVNITPHQH